MKQLTLHWGEGNWRPRFFKIMSFEIFACFSVHIGTGNWRFRPLYALADQGSPTPQAPHYAAKQLRGRTVSSPQ